MLEIKTTQIGVSVRDEDRGNGFIKTIKHAPVVIEHDGSVFIAVYKTDDRKDSDFICQLEIPYHWFVWLSDMIQMPAFPKKGGDDVDTD